MVRVVLLAGGVGGAKLAEGLAAHLGDDLTVIVNTGDDLELHGLSIWPDHDTVGVHACGARRRGPRLGPARRDVGRHGRPRGARRRAVVPPRRPGPGHPPLAYGPTPRRRQTDRGRAPATGAPGDRVAHPADGRRARPDRGQDRRRLARVPGVLRPPPPGPGRPRGPLPRHRGGASDARGDRRARGGRGRRHRAVEPDRLDRADPRGPRPRRRDRRRGRARGARSSR